MAATLDEKQGELVLFLVNRNASDATRTSVRLGSWPDARLTEALVVGGGDPWATSTREHPEGVAPRKLDEVALDGGSLDVVLPAASWSVIRLATSSSQMVP
jgi:alpha-N-arabinofuranosidase